MGLFTCTGVDEGDGPVMPVIARLTPLPLSGEEGAGDEGVAKPCVRVGATLASVPNAAPPKGVPVVTKMREGNRIAHIAHMMCRSPISAAGKAQKCQLPWEWSLCSHGVGGFGR